MQCESDAFEEFTDKNADSRDDGQCQPKANNPVKSYSDCGPLPGSYMSEHSCRGFSALEMERECFHRFNKFLHS